jgi:hypothetical protein
MGLDSLMAVELQNLVGARVARKLPVTLLFDHPTVSRLADHLLTDVLAFEERAAPAVSLDWTVLTARLRRADPATLERLGLLRGLLALQAEPDAAPPEPAPSTLDTASEADLLALLDQTLTR